MGLDEYLSRGQRPDWLLALLALGLSVFGLAMILSASAYLAGTTGEVYAFVSRQAISLGIGLVALLVTSQIDYRQWKAWAGPILVTVLVLLITVLISPAHRGVHRWIELGPIFFQPAELVKLGFLIYLAAWFAKLGPTLKDLREGLVPFLVLLGMVSGLVILEPDMGTAVTLIAAAFLVFILAGATLTQITLTGLIGIVLLLLLIVAEPYRLERLQTFLNPLSDPQGSGYQTQQIQIAIGSGGLWGLGFGQGKLKYLGYVPEVHTDSIFAVIAEELGFVRSLVLVALFTYLIVRAFRIAKQAPDPFGRYLAAGIASLIAVQTAINIAAMLGVVPLTGIPLPFVSYGGSSLVVFLAGIGILLAISRQTERTPG